ncbi:MAG: DotU family type IV/VI secretion system protein [Achromobacter sp.]|uniref:DotU family type IV/VI secretion system protein n=1 Tax=Achromobacter sp. TaxID=134375 RepID=UPI003D0460AA
MRLSNIWIASMELARTAITGAGTDATPDAEVVRGQLKASLDAAVERVQAHGFTAADAQASLFAVVAWIDELAMSRDWAASSSWRLAPLQRHYFSTTRAGVAFFEKLEALPDDAVEVREVYGLALLAGFSGRYTHRPPAELAEYRAALLARIAEERRMSPLDPSLPLFPQAGGRARKVAPYRRGIGPSLATFFLVVVPLCLLLGLYLYLDYRVAGEAAQVAVPTATRS